MATREGEQGCSGDRWHDHRRVPRVRAEALRLGVKELEIRNRGTAIGQVTASIGLAAYPANGTSAADVVKAAHGALYEAKHAGRDRVVVAAEREPRKLSA